MEYPIDIIKEKIDKEYLKKFLDNPFHEMIKFVVDTEKQIIAFGGELHSDAAEKLVEEGSDNRNLWGGNLYPLKGDGEKRIEYISLINIKPTENSFSMDIEDKNIIIKIDQIIEKLVDYGK
ncbi:hypothetical protein KAW43_03690 [Candidatus Parcubacteria bacterium]|nr:hypothetical protein [Candidatus Parcubacteria bacterium]